MKLLFSLIFQTLSVFLLLHPAYAQNTYWVRSTNATGTDCLNPNNPCPTINLALAEANGTPATVDIINVLPGKYTEQIDITTPVALRGVIDGAGTLPVAPTFTNRSLSEPSVETELIFAESVSNNITIAAGLNNVTIEGFKFATNIYFDAVTPGNTSPLIEFAAGNYSNITIRRNIYHGDSDFGNESPYLGIRPLILLPAGANIVNLQLTENRIYGLQGLPVPSIGLNGTFISGQIRENIFGSIDQGTLFTTLGIESGVEVSNTNALLINRNHFQKIARSAITINNTVNTADLDTVRINYNTFRQVNLQANPFTDAKAFAGVLFRANQIGGDSLVISNNDFAGNNRIAISIPNANQNYSTDGIKIFENLFGVGTVAATNNTWADLYVGDFNITPTGLIDANVNWWGNPSPNFTPRTGGAAITTDILGGANARGRVLTAISLVSNVNSTPFPGLGFKSNENTMFSGVPTFYQTAFDAIPENWTLQIPSTTPPSTPINYGSSVATIKRSFKLDPVVNNFTLPGFILDNGNANISPPVVTLLKSLQISSNLTFTRGIIALANNNLTLTGSIAGTPGTNSFILTEGTGQFRQLINGTTKIFPVGHDADSYTPATITVPGAFTFAVRAEPIEDDPVSPIVGNSGQTTLNAVGVIWQINKQTPGNPNATLTLQWNEADELSGFNDAASYISKYDSTQSLWVNQEWPATPASSLGGGVWQRTVAGINSFSPFIIAGNNAPLPVDLISFDAELQNRGVLLTWNTASEKNNAYFAIERSIDSRTFAEIGKVTGRGTVEHINSYNFTDAGAAQTGIPVVYYRLKQVDTDGKFSYSKVESVTLDKAVVKLFPNPASQRVTVTAPGNTQVQVINGQGQTVLQKAFSSSTELDISSLSKGMYIFRFLQKDKITSQKVCVF